ncbi:inositol monophosphatase family protein [Kitasatospora paracochleata]|uniref:Myo-inositol-1(Or 4)-monophosphatase n=2 Tax=Kitasatospora paracochleata TaxID=58354 RepID=A0ABT1J096_9ACTN|nr:inositol monophosphatase family protein [Kitasatospora paracochleata]MCP2310588.1 myo-inositol-1(or 4)-monophosphatase [Kitasatospora paracochleata]
MELLAETVEAVRVVGDHLVGRQGTEPAPAVTLADALEVFTALDDPASALLRERLTRLRPGAGWLEDELASRVPADGEWWVCDATDGAVQYLHGMPHWAVTATLVRDGEPVLAVVHAPRVGATYAAELGGGAVLDGRAMAPARRELSAAVAATSQPPLVAQDPVALRRAGESLSAVLPWVLAVRNLGPTALQVAQVGSGHLSLFWEYGSDAGNLLPGALIAREAGARVTDARGGRWTPAADSFVAAAPSLHGDLLAVLREIE